MHQDDRPRDPLGAAASAVFDDLASGDIDNLERRSAPYKHNRRIRLLMHAAGRDPACTRPSDAGLCTAIVIGLLFTAAWQITAVVIAARFELGFTAQPLAVALSALAVALVVVIFDWSIIQSHVQGGTGRKTWLTRALFTLCMILLVSEVVASAVFDNDIRAQLITDNAGKESELERKIAVNRDQQDDERRAIRALQKNVADAQVRVQQLANDLEDEENGYTTAAGRGPKWNTYNLQLKEAQQVLASAELARDDPQTGVRAHEDKIKELQAQARGLGGTVGVIHYERLGPAQREALLWDYLLDHPSALFLKRIPLFVILVCLDLFALLLGLAVSRRTQEQHDSWAAEQREWAVAARYVRARVLQDAKRMIGHLVFDGMMGAAEQRARRARQRRAYHAFEESVYDRREHEARKRAAAGSGALDDHVAAARVGDVTAEAWPRVAAPHIPSPRDDPHHRRHEETRGSPAAAAAKLLNLVEPPAEDDAQDGAEVSDRTAATTKLFHVVDRVDGDGQVAVPLGPETHQRMPPEHYEVKLKDDPGRQSDEDLAPFLDEWYKTDHLPVRAERRLETAASQESRRATLLVGVNAQQRHHVIKLFSVSGADNFTNNDLSRDAGNAHRMTQFSGGLRPTTARESWLAPGYFGTKSILDYPDVPYLVMPYYPSGSVKEYLGRRSRAGC